MSTGVYPAWVRRIHWITVGLFIFQWLSRSWADGLPEDSELAFHLNGLHTIGGLAILVLAATRLVLRWRQGSPGWPIGMGRWQRAAAAAVHGALYVIMLTQPLVGLAAVRIPSFATVHIVLAWAALGLIALHVGVALWHEWVAKDRVFRRIRW